MAYPSAVGDASGRHRRVAGRFLVRRLVPVLVLVLLLAGCRADVAVEIEAAANGGGHVRATVTLDKEAAVQVPDLAQQLRVDDLEAAGWTVDGPSPAHGRAGGVTLRVTKPFTTPEGAARTIEELSGAGGPFSTLRLTRERGFWKTKTSLTGTVDLTAGLGAFGDAALTETLGAPNLGLDPAAVERELGRPLSETVRVELTGRLPGTVTSNAPSSLGGGGVWPVVLGATSAVTASSEAWNVLTLALAGLAAVSGLALLVVLVRRSRFFSWM